jgi:hypothetical protein
MLNLLRGDPSVTITQIQLTMVPDGGTITVTDPDSLSYFATMVSRSQKEGFVPSRPQQQHYAILKFGTLSSAKVGIYADPVQHGITIYYPYHEDAPTDIEYYWVPLTDPIPPSLSAFYEALCVDTVRRGRP